MAEKWTLWPKIQLCMFIATQSFRALEYLDDQALLSSKCSPLLVAVNKPTFEKWVRKLKTILGYTLALTMWFKAFLGSPALEPVA